MLKNTLKSILKFKLKTAPHHHSGKLLSVGHTSHAGLLVILLLAGALLALAHVSVNANANSDTIRVTATVPAQIPLSAPTIDYPADGEVFAALPVWVRGKCDQEFVVKLYRNDVFSGSTVCKDGRYSLRIDLFQGKNVLIARQVNTFNQSSPDSNAVTVYYEPAVSDQVRQLVVVSDQDYFGTLAGKNLELPLEIIGGVAPYAVTVDWGDGRSRLLSRERDGRFVLDKLYRAPGVYYVNVKVVDVDDREAHLSVVVIVQGGTVVAPTFRDSWLLPVLWPIYVLCLLMVIMFWFGERYELNQLRRQGRLKNA